MPDQAAMDARQTRASKQVVSRGRDAFARAQRHSKRVRALKFWLPALAAVGIIGFVSWSYVAIPRIEGVSADGAAVIDGKLVMANPKMDGFTKDNLPYSMRAARATQDLGSSDVIHLEDIDASLPVNAENTAKILAQRGIYDNQKNTLTIDSPIQLTTTDGIVAKFQSANVEMGSGSMSTPDPVQITMDGTRIKAESLRVTDNGAVMIFERRVRVDIQPNSVKKSEAKSGEPNAAQ